METHEESVEIDNDDQAPQYVRRVHQYPEKSSRSGLVRNAGGGSSAAGCRRRRSDDRICSVQGSRTDLHTDAGDAQPIDYPRGL